MMRAVCAYCGRDMGEKMGPDGAVTHGICIPCLQKEERKMERWCKNCGKNKIAYDAPPEQVWCDDCITDAETREAEEDETCPTCNGCGEGQFEGTKCMTCHGRGTILTEAHQEAFDAEQDRREDARQEALEAQREMEEPPEAGYPDYGADYPGDSAHRQDEARRMK